MRGPPALVGRRLREEVAVVGLRLDADVAGGEFGRRLGRADADADRVEEADKGEVAWEEPGEE